MCIGQSQPSFAAPPTPPQIQAPPPAKPTGSLRPTTSADTAGPSAQQQAAAAPASSSPHLLTPIGEPRNPGLVKTLDARDAFNNSPVQQQLLLERSRRTDFSNSLRNAGSFLG